jgi:hypothetical protein
MIFIYPDYPVDPVRKVRPKGAKFNRIVGKCQGNQTQID